LYFTLIAEVAGDVSLVQFVPRKYLPLRLRVKGEEIATKGKIVNSTHLRVAQWNQINLTERLFFIVGHQIRLNCSRVYLSGNLDVTTATNGCLKARRKEN
jgi:hypothetical protein